MNVEHGGSLETLLELSVKVTAKQISCWQLEKHRPPLDEAILKKVTFWACPQDTRLVKTFADVALRDCRTWKGGESGEVRDMTQVGFMVTCVVGLQNVSFTFEKLQITSTYCEACPKQAWCSHIIAAVLYRMKNARTIPIHAPVTETLSTMNRDQLQKLLHYAIDEDPKSVLGTVFRRLGNVRDTASNINLTPGLPDPTVGLGQGTESVWDLTLKQLRGSFYTACHKRVDNFPCSFKASDIQASWIYANYLQRVVDLAQTGQAEAAGQLLITYVKEATDIACGKAGVLSTNYRFFLQTLEKMCVLFILHFEGEARCSLALLCKSINKNMNVIPVKRDWAELPALSSLFPFETKEAPGILGGRQTSLFYEPLCAQSVPDPGKDFNELLDGTIEPWYSNYNEPLALMMMRFEALKLWMVSTEDESKVLRLGAVVIRKLLQMTHQFSIIQQFDNERETNIRTSTIHKRKASEETEATRISYSTFKSKRRKTSCLENNEGTAEESCTTTEFNNGNNGLRIKDNASLNSDAERLQDIYSLTKGVATIEDGHKVYLTETDTEQPNSPDYLGIMIDCLEQGDSDMESSSKVNLSYCLMYTCRSVFECSDFDTELSGTDYEMIAQSILRALELSRFRFLSESRNSISSNENSAWDSLEQNLITLYKNKIGRVVKTEVSSRLQRLYMKKLCQCNRGGMCFFGNAVPLGLISLLVKKTLQGVAPENKEVARCLCLFTLCHSNLPQMYYMSFNNDTNHEIHRESRRYWMISFEDIVISFLQHLRRHPGRNAWLLKLLSHYETVQDGKALYYVLKGISRWSLDGESKEFLVGLLKLLLRLVAIVNKGAAGITVQVYVVYGVMMRLCYELEIKFIEIVVGDWKEIAQYFRFDQCDRLVNTMTTFVTPDTPLPDNVVTSITAFFGETFKHTPGTCLVLNFVKHSDVQFDTAFDIVRRNAEHFTPEALLYVADQYNQAPFNVTQSRKIFNRKVEKTIKCAVERIAKDEKPRPYTPCWFTGRFLPVIKPSHEILWIFKTFLEKPPKMVINCSQFADILSLFLEAYSDDLQTLLSICSCVESEELVVQRCKHQFEESIIKLVNNLVFERLSNIYPRYYREFSHDLSEVQVYFTKYVTDGPTKYKLLLEEIKRNHNTKTKLMSVLNLS